MTNITTFDLTFPNAATAAEHLTGLRYVRLPVAGPVARFVSTLYTDDGIEYLSFASVSRRHEDGSISYKFVGMP